MGLDSLKPPAGARRPKKRIGRGHGSGTGKTAGKGTKGQMARSGGKTVRGFEGGQMPLQRRLPKRGFKNIFRREVHALNVRDLDRFEAGSVVDPDALRDVGLLSGAVELVKLLGEGELDRALTVRLHRISASARQKVEAAGGTVELI